MVGCTVPGPATASPVHRRIVALCALVALLMCSPLLAGCLKRSTTVGDRFSGSIVAASSPDNPAGTPQIDVPDSMTDQVSVSEFSQDPKQNADSPKGNGTDSDKNPAARLRLAGTKASFVDLTMGQLAQLGDMIADSFGDIGISVDLSATRRDGIVRFRGTADLTGLLPTATIWNSILTFRWADQRDQRRAAQRQLGDLVTDRRRGCRFHRRRRILRSGNRRAAELVGVLRSDLPDRGRRRRASPIVRAARRPGPASPPPTGASAGTRTR